MNRSIDMGCIQPVLSLSFSQYHIFFLALSHISRSRDVPAPREPAAATATGSQVQTWVFQPLSVRTQRGLTTQELRCEPVGETNGAGEVSESENPKTKKQMRKQHEGNELQLYTVVM
jgi:hypothetical protein